jgi:hypothetical protein
MARHTVRKTVERTEYSDASSFLKALDPRLGPMSTPGWVFRGQSDARWPLQPSALRRDAWLTLPHLSSVSPQNGDLLDQISTELGAVAAFAREADRQGLQVPGYDSLVTVDDDRLYERLKSLLQDGLGKPLEFPPVEWESMFGMAQHYGIPTRLLDWSESAFVAVYFAALEAARQLYFNSRLGQRWLSVWGLNVDLLSPLEPSDRWGKLRVVRAPWATNPNLRAQRGLFTLHRCAYKLGKGARMSTWERITASSDADLRIIPIPRPRSLDDVVEGLWEVAPGYLRETYLDKPVMRSLCLRWSQAPALLEMLCRMGFSSSTLFPGYEGATRSLKEVRFQGEASRKARTLAGIAVEL